MRIGEGPAKGDLPHWRYETFDPVPNTRIVYTDLVKNITLSADEDLIERARAIARAQRKTLNAVFREWLAQFAANAGDTRSFDTLMKRMKRVDAGQHFSRDQMNER